MREADVIILGTGAAGMAAALAAHETGAEVLLVEKWDRVGGTSAISGGVIWVADNPRMRAAGMADSRADALAYFRSLDHGDLVDETIEAFVDSGPEALAFLESIDALSVSVLPGYPDYYTDRPGAKPQGSRALDHDLFDLDDLGEWAARIYAIEEPKPLMLRETPIGGATEMVSAQMHGRTHGRAAMRLWSGDGGAVAEGVSGARDRTAAGRHRQGAAARWRTDHRDRG